MTPIDELPPFLRVEQVMELTQLGRSQVYKLMKLWDDSDHTDGLPYASFGRCKRISKHALVQLAVAIAVASDGGHDR